MKDWNVPIGTKMYFLFGKEASTMYFNNEPVEEILRAAEEGDIRYDLFVFEQGKTNPASLLAALMSFKDVTEIDYAVLDSEEDFQTLNTVGQ